VQPDWLYNFLLDPTVIRPEGHMLLRMPKFNMSPEESRALVNYFAGSSRIMNPLVGLTAPYVKIDQKEKSFWQNADAEYRARLKRYESGEAAEQLQKEIQQLEKYAKPEDASAQQKLTDLKNDLAFAKEMQPVAKEQLGEADKVEADVRKLKDEVEKLEKAANDKDNKDKDEDAKKLQAKKKELAAQDQGDLYSRQAYRLLTSQTSACFSCHNVGSAKASGEQGPNLALAAGRLRPGWMEHWIGNPRRMFPYPPIMSAQFPASHDPLQWTTRKELVGTQEQRVRATRDLLLDSARLHELLELAPPAPVAPAPTTPPKNDGEKK